MKGVRKLFFLAVTIMIAVSLSGCNFLANEFGKLKSMFKGREAIIQTYDEESNIIDRIEGASIDIGANKSFEIRDSEGNVVEKSGVLSITVDGKTMMHVGSSLILAEKGLRDVFREYQQTVNIRNDGGSVPIVNRMINSMKNLTAGQKLMILVRSQSGKPLATYVGNNVSYFSTEIDKSTGFIIDGKYLFIYRCDYTIYDLSLLN